MSEILAAFAVRASLAYWLVLDCGHWFKWTGGHPPIVGADLDCPGCGLPVVVRPSDKALASLVAEMGAQPDTRVRAWLPALRVLAGEKDAR